VINFSREITDKAIKEHLAAGSVIKVEVVFSDGERKIKRLVVLSNNNDITVLAVTATSNPISGIRHYGYDDIFVKLGSETVFNKDTFIQLNRVLEIPTEKLKQQYHNHELEMLGSISDVLLKNIYAVIEKSKMIERKYIKRILDERLN
jgi:hypothetical protein